MDVMQSDLENFPLHVFAMKEEYHFFTIMSTYEKTFYHEKSRNIDGVWIILNKNDNFHN